MPGWFWLSVACALMGDRFGFWPSALFVLLVEAASFYIRGFYSAWKADK